MTATAEAYGPGPVACFRFADPRHSLIRVRLLCGPIGSPDLGYMAEHGAWELRVPWPEVNRLEYRLELTDRHGGTETICDPQNHRRAPGGFGESSVLWSPGYREPDWLHLPLAE